MKLIKFLIKVVQDGSEVLNQTECHVKTGRSLACKCDKLQKVALISAKVYVDGTC